MEFFDDEVSVSQSIVLVPSSQDLPSTGDVRPNKRRRLNEFPDLSDDEDSGTNEDDYALPSNEVEDADEFDKSKSKYDALIHVPVFAESQKNEFVTQVDQPWSSPTAIRGPRWRKKDPTPSPQLLQPTQRQQNRQSAPSLNISSRPINTSNTVLVDEFDDGDTEVFEAIIAGENEMTRMNWQSQTKRIVQSSKNMRQTTLFGMDTTHRDQPIATQSRVHSWPVASRNEPPTHHKIDKNAMQTWTYPLNVGTIRDYQFNIVHRALFHNILVALPTGLGKTFIAATVMLNFFNWTDDSQIVFVAPTKPLVAQQVDACFHIAGIPRSQTTLLTGEIQPAIRGEEWQEKRVFFMTPQTLVNDLRTGLADPKKIVLLVVDEAHKATGNYAYVEVVRFLRRFNSSFRVLALTATPGATVEAVQKVIDGLGIARVEIRNEESMDIRSYVHTRNEEIKLFDNSEEIEQCLDLFATAVQPVLSKVNGLNAYYANDPKTITVYGLVKGREQWVKSDAGRNANWGLKSMIQACFKPLMSLAHALELLKFHGIGPFYHKMKIFDEDAREGGGKYTKQITDTDAYKKLMSYLRAWINDDDFVGHPKLTYLNEVVLNHFMDAGNGLGVASGRPPSDTRIMVFAHYRDSAEEIVRVLNRHQPLIRARVFVGQSGTKGSEGMDQKTQIDIIKKFKAGTFNTLVATSIGEEGLDIGEVDLIVCYDSSQSPIRMLQRMGRTGRKRAGNIVLLLMRGKEEKGYYAAKDNYAKMQAIIESGKDFQFHEDTSPRIVPREIQPVVDKRNVDIPIENTQAEPLEPRKRRPKTTKRPPKKFNMPDNVETGFKFLGGGKASKHISNKNSITKLMSDHLEAGLPSLQQILLSTKDQEDLERRYAQIAGTEIQFVQPVRFDIFPKAIHKAGKTMLVKHSITTKRMISASKAMRNQDRGWERPKRLKTFETFEASLASNSQEFQTTDDRSSISHSELAISQESGNQLDDNDYDLNDDFVDDGPIKQTLTSSRTEETSDDELADEDGSSQHTVTDQPFYVSQQSMGDHDNEVEELPEMGDLFTKLSSTRTDKKASQAAQAEIGKAKGGIKRRRRVLSDDSDE